MRDEAIKALVALLEAAGVDAEEDLTHEQWDAAQALMLKWSKHVYQRAGSDYRLGNPDRTLREPHETASDAP